MVQGRMAVRGGDARRVLEAGQWHIVNAGSPHTFATVHEDEPVRLLVVMTPEIDALVEHLHDPDVDFTAVWADHRSSLVP